ncbi:MAG TPA: alcohol dehydrogenase catalytic domain-containing protein [Gaiellaceae bacterium]|nr:alcohol dehydrogenase catalytic domain-containing protein [Gaiellaceae bacterium]
MLAARWHGRRDIRVDEIPEPDAPPPGWVKVRVAACGICGTDLEEYTGGPVLIPTERHPLTGALPPLTLGHETVGVVEQAAADVALEPGTRVAVEGNVVCGTCRCCVRGDYQLCERLGSLGLMGDGGLAEWMLAPAYTCIPYGGHVEAETAALAEPLSVAVRAARRGRIAPGSTVGVVGAGTIGLLVAQTARAAGAETVLVVDRHEPRRRLALEHGADAAVDPADALAAAAELTGGAGFDVTVEAAGNADALRAAVGLAGRGGRTVLLGVSNAEIGIPMVELLMAEKELIASLSHCHDTDFAEAVRLLDAGAIDTSGIVSDVVPLERVVEAFDELLANPADHLKVVVVPS